MFSVLSSCLRGWVLQKLWAWFIASWFGVAMLSLPVALGLSTIVTVLILDVSITRDKHDWSVMIVFSITHSLIALGVGWIITLFM